MPVAIRPGVRPSASIPRAFTTRARACGGGGTGARPHGVVVVVVGSCDAKAKLSGDRVTARGWINWMEEDCGDRQRNGDRRMDRPTASRRSTRPRAVVAASRFLRRLGTAAAAIAIAGAWW
ncbi:hypothetical protein SEVIR_2G417750v4 [Setaria viridis]